MATGSTAAAGMPRFLQRPKLTTWPGAGRNTDPVVFGAGFRYSNCRQSRNQKLRSLAPGSMILFGSCMRVRFVLDTVMVLANSEPFDTNDLGTLMQREPDLTELVWKPLAADPTPEFPLCWYRGATVADPFEGMYSFVPCLPFGPPDWGFPRPDIDLDGLIDHRLSAAAKVIYMDHHTLRTYWQRVRERVLEAGLSLGTSVAMPPLITGSGQAPLSGNTNPCPPTGGLSQTADNLQDGVRGASSCSDSQPCGRGRKTGLRRGNC